jgi:nicotinamidase-related amidase
MTPRLTVANSTLVVVDVQTKLLTKIVGADELVRNCAFLLDAAKRLGVAVQATEQYPKGLGPTHADLLARLPRPLPAKTAFSCAGCPGFLQELRASGRSAVVLVGIEAHVCVSQTAFDLLDAGFTVFLPVDAISSRSSLDRDTALRRLEKAGAIPTTSEAVAFEWTGDAAHAEFKAISKLVIERSNPIGTNA